MYSGTEGTKQDNSDLYSDFQGPKPAKSLSDASVDSHQDSSLKDDLLYTSKDDDFEVADWPSRGLDFDFLNPTDLAAWDTDSEGVELMTKVPKEDEAEVPAVVSTIVTRVPWRVYGEESCASQ